jgi:tyrosine-protein kinase Etk/Wzc
METRAQFEARTPEIPTPGNEFRTVAIEPIEPPQADLFGILLTLASHKWLIGGMTLLGAGLATVVALRMAPVYRATAVILPPPQQRPGIAAFLGQLTPAASALAGADLMRSPADLYIALLSSRSVADGIIGDQRLVSHYGARSMTQARTGLAGRTRFASGKDTLVRINVQDRDPGKAAAVANAYIDHLYKLTSRFAMAESAQRRTFYEQQFESEKRELAAAEAGMRAVQEKTGLLQVNSQVEVVIRSAAQLRAEITSREVMLEGLQSGATDQNPEVIRLRTEIESLRVRLRRLESSRVADEASGLVLPAGEVPGAGLEYLRALRQLRYHESLSEALARQHEAARIDEAKQAAVVQVVDYAIPPEFKSGPRRTLLVALGAISMAALASAFVLGRKSLAETGRAARLRLIAQVLWSGK